MKERKDEVLTIRIPPSLDRALVNWIADLAKAEGKLISKQEAVRRFLEAALAPPTNERG